MIVPEEARDYIKNKKLVPGFSYEDVWREEHKTAFTVAKCMDLDLLSDIQDSLVKALEDGTPYETWAKNMASTMAKAGWWGEQEMTDPKTGEVKTVQLGSPRRLEVIFNTNMRMAYQAGDWEKGQSSKAHQFAMYTIGPSIKHRREHLLWDGLILDKNDPWWDKHMPPNGWGCKCRVKFLTRAEAERLKKTGIIDETKRRQGQPLTYKKVKTIPPMDIPAEYFNKRKGETYLGIKGISPGFEYNPGNKTVRQDNISQTAIEKNQEYQSTYVSNTKPTSSSLETPVSAGVKTTSRKYGKAVKEVLSSIDKVHGDGNLIGCEVLAKGISQSYGAYSPGYPGIPKKISIYSSCPNPEYTLAHEIGHYIDYEGLSHSSSVRRRTDADEPLIKKVLEEIKKSKSYKDGVEAFSDDPAYLAYWTRSREAFARAYAQYIAVKSGNEKMIAQKNSYLEDPFSKFSCWTDADFRGILKAMDELFRGEAWLENKT